MKSDDNFTLPALASFFSRTMSESASCDFMRNLGETIVALALVLAILGTIFEGIGYNASMPIVTSTQSYTSTTTGVSTIISTTSSVANVVSTNMLDTDRFSLVDEKLCYYDFRVVNLTKGQVHVTVTGANGANVSFWILSPDDYARWKGSGATCVGPAPSEGGLEVSPSGVEVPSSGPYYFLFLSPGDTRYTQTPVAPLVTLNVYIIQQSQITMMIKNVNSSTETTFSTGAVTYIAKPVGYGLIFYLGNGLIVAAVVALVISTRAKRPHSRTGRQFT